MNKIFEQIATVTAKQLGVDVNKITESSKFTSDLGADSLDLVELIMAFEEAFGCEIPDEAAEKIATVADAVKYVESKQQ